MDIITLALSKKYTAQQISALEQRFGTVFKLKGSKQVYSALPTTGQTIGDVWYVEEDETISGVLYRGQVGYVWINDDGTLRWEPLGPSIDLSAYYTKTESDNKYLAKSEVVANPTLAGTESALTGLEVGSTKYKIDAGGSTHLYRHTLKLWFSGQVTHTGPAFIDIYNTNATPFTTDTLITYLDQVSTGTSKELLATGYVMEYGSQNRAVGYALHRQNSTVSKYYLLGITPTSSLASSANLSISEETVTQIF